MPSLLGLDTSLKRSIFSGYVMLWVSSHLLVYSSRSTGARPYNATSVVLVTECVKLVMALALYRFHDGSSTKLMRDVAASPGLLLRYLIPALLYCVYNNLVYTNLAIFDPGTYNVLMQLRIVMTGVLFQTLFSKQLNRNQWSAIALIAFGCMVKESPKLSQGGLDVALGGWALLLLQMVASVFAGVYNELLLKGGARTPSVSTNLQNAYMYFNSILCNFAVLVYNGTVHEAVDPANIAALCTPTLFTIIAIMSSVGMVTGFFLKHLDSVLKSIASALEVILTTAFSRVLFATPLDGPTILAAGLVGGGVALYARSPMQPADAAYTALHADDRGTEIWGADEDDDEAPDDKSQR